MKSLIIAAITLMAAFARAEIAHETLQNAEAVVFDATCTPISATEGYLSVNLKVEQAAVAVSVRGSFYSYTESLRTTDRWAIMPLEACNGAATQLASQAGRRLVVNGDFYQKSFEEMEDVYGMCRESPKFGRRTYRCKTGQKPVTKYYHEIVLKVDGLTLFNNNNSN